jgi:HEAT repeat protein
MAPSDPLSNQNPVIRADASTTPAPDVPPERGSTHPIVLAQQAAEGRRGAAWRLMLWILDDDPRAVEAVANMPDDRLAEYLLEFIADGTWAGKPFVTPRPLRTAHARTRLRTLFLPGSGMDEVWAERVLLKALRSNRPSMREAAIYILGIMGTRDAVQPLIEALHDPAPSVRIQAAKALGRIRDTSAVPALLNAFSGDDEQLASQISTALVQIGRPAVPALLEKFATGSAWIRWQCVRALGEIADTRALPTLVQALHDPDHAVAWMAAKEVARFGKNCLEPVLRLLMNAEPSRWMIETTSYVLRDVYRHDPRFGPYLEPVVQDMHGPAPLVATPVSAQKALTRLINDGLIEPARI